MRLYARIALLLGAYLLVGGLVYGATAKDRIGPVLLLVGGAGFAYVGLNARRAVRAADRATPPAESGAPTPQAGAPAPQLGAPARELGAPAAEPGTGPPDSVPAGTLAPQAGPAEVEEVRPTIWPLVFSLAGAGIVAGVLASHWVLIAGGLLGVAAAAGWFREVLTQRHGHG